MLTTSHACKRSCRKATRSQRRVLVGWCLGVIVTLASGCKARDHNGGTTAARGARPMFTFTPEDAAILFPLKESADKDALFGTKGDGFCLAPSVADLGNVILSESAFASFREAALSFGGTACPASHPRVGERDEVLLKGKEHLALIKGLPPQACGYEHWRVVGVRFDPCAERVGFGMGMPAWKDIDPKATQDSVPPRCTAHVRVVAQPFTRNEDGPWRAIDTTLHFVYRVNDPRGAILSLKALAELKARSVSELRGLGLSDSIAQLRPHAGLWAEMNACAGPGGSRLAKTPVADAVKTFLSAYAREEHLIAASFMTSSAGPTHWSFGNVAFKDATAPLRERKVDFKKIEMRGSLSLDELNAGRMPFDNPGNELERWFSDPAFFAGAPGTAAHAQKVEKMREEFARIASPHTSSLGNVSSCFSCHMVEQTLSLVARGPDREKILASLAPREGLWNTLPRRTFNNLRNLGYGPGMAVSISARAASESDDVAKTLTAIFGDLE